MADNIDDIINGEPVLEEWEAEFLDSMHLNIVKENHGQGYHLHPHLGSNGKTKRLGYLITFSNGYFMIEPHGKGKKKDYNLFRHRERLLALLKRYSKKFYPGDYDWKKPSGNAQELLKYR